jgi:hypothetical protein
MTTLLVQSCSKSKIRAAEPVPAFELYSGYFFKILKKSIDDGEFSDDIDVCILSAEHGILDRDSEVLPYDRRMDEERASELASEVQSTLARRHTKREYDRIVVNAGAVYQRALDGIESKVDVPVHYIQGDGMGAKGHDLKRFVRGDNSVIEA